MVNLNKPDGYDKGTLEVKPGATAPEQRVFIMPRLSCANPTVEYLLRIARNMYLVFVYHRQCQLGTLDSVVCHINGTPILVYEDETVEQAVDAYLAST